MRCFIFAWIKGQSWPAPRKVDEIFITLTTMKKIVPIEDVEKSLAILGYDADDIIKLRVGWPDAHTRYQFEVMDGCHDWPVAFFDSKEAALEASRQVVNEVMESDPFLKKDLSDPDTYEHMVNANVRHRSYPGHSHQFPGFTDSYRKAAPAPKAESLLRRAIRRIRLREGKRAA